jgi:predicted DNA-binding antitoxin AbrB/MazE fold protein
MTVKAIYEDGVLKPEASLPLKEHAQVEIDIKSVAAPVEDDDPTGWKTARRFIGLWKGAPKDEPIARDHDKYLYK